MDIEELQKKVVEESSQPARHLIAKKRIRDALSPCAEYITDETIYRILFNCGGNAQRAMFKCLLALQAEAFKTRNIPLKRISRELLRVHEAGLLLK